MVDESVFVARKQFRHYTRLVKSSPKSIYHHQKRLEAASKMGDVEPIQGVAADYFFACWYEVAEQKDWIIPALQTLLPAHIANKFLAYINTGYYLPAISPLATRWSVLTVPSMSIPAYQVYVGKDEAKKLAKSVSTQLLTAKMLGDEVAVKTIQQEYFGHCLACFDKMGFMMTWFALSKQGWVFDEAWLSCRMSLERV